MYAKKISYKQLGKNKFKHQGVDSPSSTITVFLFSHRSVLVADFLIGKD